MPRRTSSMERGPAWRSLQHLVRYRMLVAAITLPLAFLLGPDEAMGQRTLALLPVASTLAVLSVIYMTGLAWGGWPRLQMGVQLAMDVMLVTWLASLTGGRHSQFVLFYVLVILSGGVLFDARGGLAVALASAACFLALPLVPGRTALSSWTDGLVEGFTSPTLPLLVGIFVAIGLLGGYLGWSVRRNSASLEKAKSEAEHAEREARQLRLDTECILSSMSTGVLTVDAQGRVLHLNPSAAEILGVEPLGASGRPLDDLLGHDGPLLERLNETLSSGRTVHRQEMRVRAGALARPIGVSTSVLLDEAGERRGVIAVMADLSEIKAAEDRARRSETLAAIGQLSAHIAHEIRNAVVPIAGSVEILEKELTLRGENQRLLVLVSRECDRLNRFVTELLDYVREPILATDVVCVNDVVRDVLDLLRRHPLGRTARLALEDDGRVLWARADGEQLKRAFVNLAQNAVESMEGKGELLVKLAPAGDNIEIAFQDQGPGIAPENLSRILEPFFTTKREGTGLGLSIASRIVERHGGSLRVVSAPGNGTSIIVELTQAAPERLAA
ncbi:MAG TPA: ATP-binding protein [Candidatus Eisenbacteria bacterium]|jgi:two-component system, NtrC family, sensor histidine kinase PilS|nr:ATP-binding protein [Candidatus Eisenbacteria bacterium]